MTQIYNTGTVTVTNGSTAVVGTGTAWAIALVAGGTLNIEAPGNPLPIASVTDDTHLTGAVKWTGASGTYSYAITLENASAATVVDLNTRMSRILVQLSLAGITPDASGSLTDRAAVTLGVGDKGFLFLHAEIGVAFAFYRWTGTAWDGPFAVANASSGPVSSLAAGTGVTIDATNPAIPVVSLGVASQAQGDILYRGSSTWQRLAKGTALQVLRQNSALTAPEWATAREVLTGARTYYVRTDGSDSNNGLANTSGGAFLTIQKAIDVVGALDISIYTVTIQVGDGTYTGGVALNGPWVGLGTVILQGNASTPTNVVISTASGVVPVSLTNKATLTLRNMKLQNAGGSASNIRVTTGAIITPTTGLHFGATGYACIDARAGGLVNASFLSANWTITTSVPRFLSITEGSLCSARFVTINVSGSYAWASQFAEVASAGLLNIDGVTWNITGTPTGKRYAVSQNGLCITGGGASYFPGDVAGTTSTQGQYL